MEDILITSGYNFEGYIITDYLGLCSGEAALGTGFLSSFGAGLADLLGTNSSMYEEKLNEARNIALENLIDHARSCGANAIIAVQIGYTAFSADIMGIAANGTAVKIEKKNESSKIDIDVINFNPHIPVRPAKFSLSRSGTEHYLQVYLADISDNHISALKGDLTIVTVFDEKYEFKDMYFYGFEQINNFKISALTPVVFPLEITHVIKHATFNISKFIENGKITDNIMADINSAAELDDTQVLISNTAMLLQHEYVSYAKSLSSANEIYNYTLEFNTQHNEFVPSDLIKSIKALAVNERLYGNLSKDCIQTIVSFYKKN